MSFKSRGIIALAFVVSCFGSAFAAESASTNYSLENQTVAQDSVASATATNGDAFATEGSEYCATGNFYCASGRQIGCNASGAWVNCRSSMGSYGWVRCESRGYDGTFSKFEDSCP